MEFDLLNIAFCTLLRISSMLLQFLSQHLELIVSTKKVVASFSWVIFDVTRWSIKLTGTFIRISDRFRIITNVNFNDWKLQSFHNSFKMTQWMLRDDKIHFGFCYFLQNLWFLCMTKLILTNFICHEFFSNWYDLQIFEIIREKVFFSDLRFQQ